MKHQIIEKHYVDKEKKVTNSLNLPKINNKVPIPPNNIDNLMQHTKQNYQIYQLKNQHPPSIKSDNTGLINDRYKQIQKYRFNKEMEQVMGKYNHEQPSSSVMCQSNIVNRKKNYYNYSELVQCNTQQSAHKLVSYKDYMNLLNEKLEEQFISKKYSKYQLENGDKYKVGQ